MLPFDPVCWLFVCGGGGYRLLSGTLLAPVAGVAGVSVVCCAVEVCTFLFTTAAAIAAAAAAADVAAAIAADVVVGCCSSEMMGANGSLVSMVSPC